MCREYTFLLKTKKLKNLMSNSSLWIILRGTSEKKRVPDNFLVSSFRFFIIKRSCNNWGLRGVMNALTFEAC